MSSEALDKFGIVTDFFKSTGLLKELDRLISKSKEHKITKLANSGDTEQRG